MISFDQFVGATGRLEVKRVRECTLAQGPITYPLRTVRELQVDEDLREALELLAHLAETDPFIEGDLLEIEDDGAHPDEDDGAKIPIAEDVNPEPEDSAIADEPGVPLRIPRARRIYIPRVGPPAPPKKRELRDDLPVTFQVENPKLPGSKVHAAYERYKTAATVGEARALGASRSMI